MEGIYIIIGVFLGFTIGVLVMPMFTVSGRNLHFVGKVVRKKGEKEEMLILEQSPYRVWFRTLHATIPQLLNEYEMKDNNGHWHSIGDGK